MKHKVVPYLLLLPHALFFAVFVIFPIGRSIQMSMARWGLFQGMVEFVGLDNFTRLVNPESFRARHFWRSMQVTVQFVLLNVPLLIAIALSIALLLNIKKLRFKGVHVTALFMPMALAATVIAVIWRWMLSYQTGLINYLLSFIGISRIPWLVNVPWVWFSIIVATLWWTLGWNILILLGGLKKIPETLYESATVDGANVLQRFVHVTLPGLKDVLMFVCITQVLASFGLFAQPQLMTQGGPGRATLPVMLHIYQTAFDNSGPYMGLGAAQTIITGSIILAFTFLQYFLFVYEKKAKRRTGVPVAEVAGGEITTGGNGGVL